MKRTILLISFFVLLGLVGCKPEPTAVPTPTATPNFAPTEVLATVDQPAAQAAAPQMTPTPLGPFGPTGFPADVNPLTGLVLNDPSVLDRRPLLVKVSNESPTVRPQSGLSFADHVWEYQMEGFAQTRYTAVFYSQTPEMVGSVRSARLIDVEHLVYMYGGILALSGASSNLADPPGSTPRVRELLLAAPYRERVVSEQLGHSDPWLVRIPDIPREGVARYHSLFAMPEAIWQRADDMGFNQRPVLDGMLFDTAVPAGGTATTEMNIDYPGSGPKHTWRYDAGSGKWLSWTDDAPDSDYLTGEQLAFDNVVIIYATHYEADFLEQEGELGELYSVGINLLGDGQAVLMRDGQRYDVTWRREEANSLMQFFDQSGNVIAFKPGTTWFNTASIYYWPPEVTFLP
jgi:hypothetical protein